MSSIRAVTLPISCRYQVSGRRSSRSLMLSAAVGLIILTWFIPFRLTVVCGESMLPTLKPGQVLLLDRRHDETHTPVRGDIIVFRHKDQVYIKRVAAAPGDDLYMLDYTLSGEPVYSVVLYPNDIPKALKLTARFPENCRLRFVSMPKDKLYVTGDAYDVSVDSRYFGPIGSNQVMGRVILNNRVLPPSGCWSSIQPGGLLSKR